MDRRQFLYASVGAGIGGIASLSQTPISIRRLHSNGSGGRVPPAYSVVPVVGDGDWVWNEPPENETGYLESRQYSVEVGIELTGRAAAWQIQATTPFPIECPEQKIEELQIEAQGCEAGVRQVAAHAAQLWLKAPAVHAGQMVRAVARCRVTLSKQYHGFHRDQFPAQQTAPRDVRNLYLGDSPGISSRSRLVNKLHRRLSQNSTHPWDLAQSVADWVRQSIAPRIGHYTSVEKALRYRRGDCEEMAGIIVAVCRAAKIPARLVWIPNHTWCEIYLSDREGLGHWLPVHTGCYFWFGWTGVHELVIQKGDRIQVPERSRPQRLLEDWMQWQGRRPEVCYPASLTPLPPAAGEDPGPGSRVKERPNF